MEQFLKVLAEFETLGGTGIVYGGCLRDTLTGKGPIKDIDIAVENTDANMAAIKRFGSAKEGTEVKEQYLGYGNFPDVFVSVQVERPGETTINFVVLGRDFPCTLEQVAKRCDFGICQVSLNRGGVYFTDEFLTDLNKRTFTYLREPFDEAQFERSKRRFARFSERYVGWEMVVPGSLLDAA